jgi:hypothetical protein
MMDLFTNRTALASKRNNSADLKPAKRPMDMYVRIPTHFGQRSDFSRTVIRFNPDTDPI